mmetsp:Transcript_6642/g.13379  ORF Transcript_6642/g.13379 Transcript_6642/m.13379 type:complete len:265 (+) Transcript_6642:339-1133(+)
MHCCARPLVRTGSAQHRGVLGPCSFQNPRETGRRLGPDGIVRVGEYGALSFDVGYGGLLDGGVTGGVVEGLLGAQSFDSLRTFGRTHRQHFEPGELRKLHRKVPHSRRCPPNHHILVGACLVAWLRQRHLRVLVEAFRRSQRPDPVRARVGKRHRVWHPPEEAMVMHHVVCKCSPARQPESRVRPDTISDVEPRHLAAQLHDFAGDVTSEDLVWRLRNQEAHLGLFPIHWIQTNCLHLDSDLAWVDGRHRDRARAGFEILPWLT